MHINIKCVRSPFPNQLHVSNSNIDIDRDLIFFLFQKHKVGDKMKLLLILSIVGVFCVNGIKSSAIPMWEYLSKDEKMSYLYAMFENQVGKFCEKNTGLMANCHNELLKYGVGKLKQMPEDHLDTMDPAQRDAHDIIWDSMMEGHEMMKSASSSTTSQPNSYDDDSFEIGMATAKIDNVYRVPPPKGFVFQVSSGEPLYTYPKNFQNKQQANNGPYARFQQQYPVVSSTTQPPLTGPMVVKVYPDGRPVYGNYHHQVPQDDDLKQYEMVKAQIPSHF